MVLREVDVAWRNQNPAREEANRCVKQPVRVPRASAAAANFRGATRGLWDDSRSASGPRPARGMTSTRPGGKRPFGEGGGVWRGQQEGWFCDLLHG